MFLYEVANRADAAEAFNRIEPPRKKSPQSAAAHGSPHLTPNAPMPALEETPISDHEKEEREWAELESDLGEEAAVAAAGVGVDAGDGILFAAGTSDTDGGSAPEAPGTSPAPISSVHSAPSTHLASPAHLPFVVDAATPPPTKRQRLSEGNTLQQAAAQGQTLSPTAPDAATLDTPAAPQRAPAVPGSWIPLCLTKFRAMMKRMLPVGGHVEVGVAETVKDEDIVDEGMVMLI